MSANDIDIDKLLADEPEEEKDLKEEPTSQEKSPEEKADETESKKEKVLKRELKKRQEEIERLKAEKEKPAEKPQGELTIDENDPAAKAWVKRIKDEAQSTVKPILDANLNRAVKRFVEKHPEYALPENKAKLKECVEASKGRIEEEEILVSLSRTWAGQNYHELEKVAGDRERSRTAVQKQALKTTSIGEGIKNEDDFTEEEQRKAEKLDMSVEEYRKALATHRRNLIQVTS